MVNINELKDYLIENDVKPSYARLRVLEYLLKYRNHPTAEDIYSELIKEIPTLSRTTIYNTLKLFVEKNIVIILSIGNNEARFDATVSNHGHFRCEDCGRIDDFVIDPDCFSPKELNGYKITGKSVYFKGICPDCLQKI